MESASQSSRLFSRPNLTLDKMEVDTMMAQMYLKENTPFRCFGSHIKVNSGLTVQDSYGNDIVALDQNSIRSYECEIKKHVPKPFDDKVNKLLNLAEKIEENIELLSQIEYLVRKTSLECNKKQLKLVAQHFFNVASGQVATIIEKNCVLMDDKPLLYLGLIANTLAVSDVVNIKSSLDSFVVCHLIAHLCATAGFKVNLLFMEYIEPVKKSEEQQENLCIGIVTERSDLDSAIDIFIESSVHAPWSLQKIYVQECIYNQFRQALRSKSHLQMVDSEAMEMFHTLSKHVFTFEDKIFLLDYAGDQTHTYLNKNIILIEAYRTTREVLCLIKLHKYMYISLWSSDISEAHEIAFGIDSPVVWINDYGVLDGPIRAAEAIYSSIQYDDLKSVVDIELQMSKSLEKMLKMIRKDLERKIFQDKSMLLQVIMDKAFVEVSDGKMCVGICHPKVALWKGQKSKNSVKIISETEFIAFATLMKTVGLKVPLEIDWQQFNLTVYSQVQAVWSNFGTIFAN